MLKGIRATFAMLIAVCVTLTCSKVMAEVEQYQVSVGQQIVIELKGNPTTGYNWQRELSRKDRRRIRIDGCGWKMKKISPKRMVGSPGTYVCKFTPVKTGNVKIIFLYQRPWEKTKPPERTRIFLLNIK